MLITTPISLILLRLGWNTCRFNYANCIKERCRKIAEKTRRPLTAAG
jgi:hypothetical protein